MKYETTIITSLTLILLSSCAIKEEQQKDEDMELKKVTYSKDYQTASHLEQKKIVACVGDQCKATIFNTPKIEVESKSDSNSENETLPISMDSTQMRFEPPTQRVVGGVIRVAPAPHVRVVSTPPPPTPRPIISTYQEHKRVIKIKRVNKRVAIQVGAFRRYRGAKIYAKRYSLLSKRYKTIIRKDIKDSRPIYRVRILGFRNKQEAREFMYKYNLNDAFLVRR